jgi:fibro-slime domain-containing protein
VFGGTVLVLGVFLSIIACVPSVEDGADPGDDVAGEPGAGGSGQGGHGERDDRQLIDPGSGTVVSPSPAPTPGILPEGFSASDLGGFRLGPAISERGSAAPRPPEDAPGAGGKGCDTTLVGIVRDFRDDHPDFESQCCGLFRGIVEGEIGAGRKPVYAHPAGNSMTSGQDNFDQWYRTISGVNVPHWIYLHLEPNEGVYTFHSRSYFPLDGAGWGNQGRSHNYHFTTELHTKFRYKGGEVFRFAGDDDVFVFINGQLVIDLGGVHGVESAAVDLDEVALDIGLTRGQEYDLDLFQAERRTTESNFRIDTTLELVNCGYVPPPVIR